MILDIILSQNFSLILLLAVLFTLILSSIKQYHKLRHIPGPWYCRISNVALTYHEITNTRTKWIHSLHQRYGPVICISSNEVHFNTPEALKPIYGVSTTVAKNEFYNVYSAYGESNMFSTIDPKLHAEKRRGLAHLYSRTSLGRPEFQKKMLNKVASVVKVVDEAILKNAGVLDVYLLLNCYTVDVVSSLVYGDAFGTNTLLNTLEGRRNRDRVKADLVTTTNWARIWRKAGYFSLCNVVLSVDWISAKARSNLPFLFSQKRDNPSIDDYIPDAGTLSIDSHLNKQHSETTLVSKLLDRGETHPSILSESRDHIIAGSDTTTNVLAFLIHHLATHPSLRRLLRDSLHASKSAAAIADNGIMAFTDIEGNETLDAIIKESLRLWTAIPMTLPRVTPPPPPPSSTSSSSSSASSSLGIAGVRVPGNTQVGVQSYSLHRNPLVFPDPERFNHTRWLQTTSDEQRKRMEEWSWPFSSGSRSCIGQPLAIMELKYLVSTLTCLFDYDMVEQGKNEKEMAVEMDERVTSFTMTPKVKNLEMRFTRRQETLKEAS